MPSRALVIAFLLIGCTQTNRRMQIGLPLEVEPGICLVHTSFKQDGREINWDDTVQKLSKFKDSSPYIDEGNSYAVGSIATTVLFAPAIIVGATAKRSDIGIDDGARTAHRRRDAESHADER